MAKGLEAGKGFLTGLRAKLSGQPEALAHLDALLVVDPFVVEVGNGVAGQSEIDRQLQELAAKKTTLDTQAAELADKDTQLKTWQGELTDWRTQNVEFVDLGVKAKKAGWKPGDPPPSGSTTTATLPANVMTREEHAEYARNTEAAILGLTAEQNALMREHHVTFGEFLDVTPLLKHPKVREIGLRGAYEEIHREALAAKKTEAAQKREADIRADERQKVLAANATALPYPLSGSVGADSSPLTAIGKPAGTALVDAATAEYQRLQAQRPA